MAFLLHGRIKDGIIVKASNLGLSNFNIADILKRHFNYKEIYLRNDAKCAALCEKQYGSLKEYKDSVFICLGTGIGSAAFINETMLKPKESDGFELRTYGNKKRWRKM